MLAVAYILNLGGLRDSYVPLEKGGGGEMANTADSKSAASQGLEGSSPSPRTNVCVICEEEDCVTYEGGGI